MKAEEEEASKGAEKCIERGWGIVLVRFTYSLNTLPIITVHVLCPPNLQACIKVNLLSSEEQQKKIKRFFQPYI